MKALIALKRALSKNSRKRIWLNFALKGNQVECPCCKKQFETFISGPKEDFDSLYERLQHLISMLELNGAEISKEDANIKLLRALPSQWNVVTTMMRGQAGLENMDLDDL